MDLDIGKERRQLQRDSWLHYPNIWNGKVEEENRRQEPTILVRYLVALHPKNNYQLSESIVEEARQYKDVIVLNMKEGKSTTGKVPGGKGYWGIESEVGMSRKGYAWYCLASQKYPKAKFIMKGDDDFFLRSVRYEQTLKTLPQERLYWGPVMKWGAKKGDPSKVFRFVGGMAVTMSSDLARWIAGNKEIAKRYTAYRDKVAVSELPRGAPGAGGSDPDKLVDSKAYYKHFNMDHEDVMVARMFYDFSVPHTIVKDCRFHDVHVGANVKPMSPRSIGIHHVKVHEYAELLKKYPDDNTTDHDWLPSSEKHYFLTLPPELPKNNDHGAVWAQLC